MRSQHDEVYILSNGKFEGWRVESDHITWAVMEPVWMDLRSPIKADMDQIWLLLYDERNLLCGTRSAK